MTCRQVHKALILIFSGLIGNLIGLKFLWSTIKATNIQQLMAATMLKKLLSLLKAQRQKTLQKSKAYQTPKNSTYLAKPKNTCSINSLQLRIVTAVQLSSSLIISTILSLKNWRTKTNILEMVLTKKFIRSKRQLQLHKRDGKTNTKRFKNVYKSRSKKTRWSEK